MEEAIARVFLSGSRRLQITHSKKTLHASRTYAHVFVTIHACHPTTLWISRNLADAREIAGSANRCELWGGRGLSCCSAVSLGGGARAHETRRPFAKPNAAKPNAILRLDSHLGARRALRARRKGRPRSARQDASWYLMLVFVTSPGTTSGEDPCTLHSGTGGAVPDSATTTVEGCTFRLSISQSGRRH